MPCDVFVTESTFALPIYRWDPTALVIGELLEWWTANREQGLTSIVFCYTIGKAQRLLAELAAFTDRPVLVHLSSKDVLHSFGLIEMRVKQDAVPGMSMPVWFIRFGSRGRRC